ncbi:MAG: GNAT family N-acetyltransferase [Defluviitaleaceae bacterium]|nr:GNAT family N-acetyltransferase [Defluviitaleaceae bacterium]
MSEAIKIIPTVDYAALESLVAEYLPGTDSIKSICANFPAAVVGYYVDGALIGCAYGAKGLHGGEGCFQLSGIAIKHPYNGHGRGGKLLTFFERQVANLGYARISLGSAGGYVEQFYIKNGYRPVELKILVASYDWKMKQHGHATPSVEAQGEYTKLVFPVDDYYAIDKDKIMGYYGGMESFFVFEKIIA